MAGTLSGEQRESLLRSKLTALARDLYPDRGSVTVASSSSDQDAVTEGAVAQVRGALTGLMEPAGPGFALTEFGTPASVAGAISWAASQGCTELTIFVDLDGGVAARYASYFGSGRGSGSEHGASGPRISVRSVSGASSSEATPEPLPPIDTPPAAPAELLEIMMDHDLQIVSEHGVVRGEILGLEVARLVRWPVETGGDGELHLEVGVGRFDRDAVWAVRNGTDMDAALTHTVAMVREYRRSGAPPHPIGRLRRERWLRSTILDHPELVGATELEPVAMTVEAAGLKDPHPAGAVGTDERGRTVVVVTAAGVDLSVVPLAADLRSRTDAAARLVVAVPPSDVHPVLGRLASMLSPGAEIVPVPGEW